MNKIYYSHTIEYYSLIKENEVQIHATIGMYLENVMLTERGQSHIK